MFTNGIWLYLLFKGWLPFSVTNRASRQKNGYLLHFEGQKVIRNESIFFYFNIDNHYSLNNFQCSKTQVWSRCSYGCKYAIIGKDINSYFKSIRKANLRLSQSKNQILEFFFLWNSTFFLIYLKTLKNVQNLDGPCWRIL